MKVAKPGTKGMGMNGGQKRVNVGIGNGVLLI